MGELTELAAVVYEQLNRRAKATAQVSPAHTTYKSLYLPTRRSGWRYHWTQPNRLQRERSLPIMGYPNQFVTVSYIWRETALTLDAFPSCHSWCNPNSGPPARPDTTAKGYL